VRSSLGKPVLIAGAVGAIVGSALLYVSASAAFGDPENSALAQTLFPYAFAVDPTLLDSPWIVLSLAFLQYPLYGAIMGFAWTWTRHRATVTIACIALMLGGHCAGVRLAHVARAAWEETQLKWE
jgi:hypothetical protein